MLEYKVEVAIDEHDEPYYWKLETVHRRYGSRFGIESSYRMLCRVRVKTFSHNPALRFFLLGFAFMEN